MAVFFRNILAVFFRDLKQRILAFILLIDPVNIRFFSLRKTVFFTKTVFPATKLIFPHSKNVFFVTKTLFSVTKTV